MVRVFGKELVGVLARNGFEGLEATKNNLVVSDIKMPGMDGFELLREIRPFGPDTAGSIPVIAMTAFVTYADRARILNAGFQECLPKPFTPDKLVEAILTVLNDSAFVSLPPRALELTF